MTTNNKQGVFKSQGLTQAELTEIKALADVCNAYEGLDLKLNWNTLQRRPENETNDFLYYEDGMLVGYLALFSFNSQEGEISGMVYPPARRKGIFTTLFRAAQQECQRRGLPTLLLIVEHVSQSGKAFAEAQGALYRNSEYKMALEEAKSPAPFDNRLLFRLAKPEEAQTLAHITAISFDIPEQEVDWYTASKIQKPTNRHYIATLDEEYVGKIDVTFEEHEVFIIGFGVLPPYRGRGYGRQMLARTIQEILTTGQYQIVLEVATENKNALSLYQSCGFRETSSYDYYTLHV